MTKSFGYTHIVKFNKTFTAGTLKGMTVEASLKFCSLADATNFATAKTKVIEPCAGNSAYTMGNLWVSAL